MKKSCTVFGIMALTALLAFGIAACGDGTESDDSNLGPTHFTGTLTVHNQQVWEPNYYTGKISQVFTKFTDNRSVDVTVGSDQGFVSVGTGTIKNGLLSFSVEELRQEFLLESDVLLQSYFSEWYSAEGADITIKPESAKGNMLTVIASYKDYEIDGNVYAEPNELLIKDGFNGTHTSLTGEYMYYFYVDAPCVITSGKVENTKYNYTFNAFELSLKAGWNTVCKTETYTTGGMSSYSLQARNPLYLRWLMLFSPY